MVNFAIIFELHNQSIWVMEPHSSVALGCVPENLIREFCFILTPYQTKKKFSGTSCIHNSQHDWWYPRYLAIWCAKDLLYLFEEHCDGFRECIGKSNGDKSSKDDDPTPSSIRGSILRCCCWRWHFFFFSSCNYAVGRNKMLILHFK